jgi:hypothetical protein
MWVYFYDYFMGLIEFEVGEYMNMLVTSPFQPRLSSITIFFLQADQPIRLQYSHKIKLYQIRKLKHLTMLYSLMEETLQYGTKLHLLQKIYLNNLVWFGTAYAFHKPFMGY